eukprot:gnl/MRDRNA2_/MRDRNA2_51372_c0_seq1.p1 gnl/MRDRNA2_/MRDRNA2_51372_c0~~gnl/MRDRNA2_/MRDRNA2_51372_c0_seq1.p1  ORF type:complete len:263 (+),score=32.96 gnl/MRDRNA2_/MRDRNA2_51372_c0_seq1:196-984(+)
MYHLLQCEWCRNGRKESLLWTLRFMDAPWLQSTEALPQARPAGVSGAHAKLQLLLAFLRGSVPHSSGSGMSLKNVLGKLCDFMAASGLWLKFAGGEKLAVLSRLARGLPTAHGPSVELGTFLGTSAAHVGREQLSCQALQVTTVEADSVHVAVARWVLRMGRACQAVEVLIGRAWDVLPRFAEDFGCHCVPFCFLDHSGSRLGPDCARLQMIRCMGCAAALCADNGLSPGAPRFVWAAVARRFAFPTNHAPTIRNKHQQQRE